MCELVEIEDRGAVRHVVMARAEKRNAMNGELVAGARRGVRGRRRRRVRARAWSCAATGRCSRPGMDLSRPARPGRATRSALRPFRAPMPGDLEPARGDDRSRRSCQIHGACIGGAMELALACDMRVMAEDAVCGLLEVRIGLIPDVGGCSRLPAVVGLGIAKELIMTGTVDRRARGAPDRVRQPDRAGRRARRGHAGALRRAARLRAARGRAREAGDGRAPPSRRWRRRSSRRSTAQQLLAGSEDFAEGARAFQREARPGVRRELKKERRRSWPVREPGPDPVGLSRPRRAGPALPTGLPSRGETRDGSARARPRPRRHDPGAGDLTELVSNCVWNTGGDSVVVDVDASPSIVRGEVVSSTRTVNRDRRTPSPSAGAASVCCW